MSRIEAIFGGVLALVVLAIAAYAVVKTQFAQPGGGSAPPADGGVVIGSGPAADADRICQCYDEAFKLAGKNVAVTSAQYRTGFEQCRALLGVRGGDAWTAGWNARLSARPYQASCRSYLRG
ncbi:hypothetical protein [Amphiplicatus metriothermophilus]|uniref:Uncharacterized protein n=1 Tax=Amphiplicatus metriothermophilus TaxID=1519374 RepID=A0A239PJV2_9PROT|nr:hypothetical protein [Amphiplicatus metriothermophilus]MBB5517573.1 hypothetical protein [Amphiplicatus metriothermophilus]SNT68092.1 hypothetical protein SAMN06297382_0588 [Amphiplicatus metriothermophilus]